MNDAAAIVLADPDPVLRAMYRIVLSDEGYLVLEAADRRGAVALAREYHPALIIMDARLASSNGAGPLGEPVDGEPIPIILMAGHDTPRSTEAVRDVLAKPLSTQQLLESVSDNLAVPNGAGTSAPPAA